MHSSTARRLTPVVLLLSFSAQAVPKFGKTAVPLSSDAGYFGGRKSDFWKLIPFYSGQATDKDDAAASIAMVLNALKADESGDTKDQNYDSASVLKKIPGLKKKGGSIDAVGDALTQYFETEGEHTASVERFDGKDSKAEMKRLQKLLTKNEKSPKDFIIANFLQAVTTGNRAATVGHFAPIGAFDANKKRVLLLDPDRKNYLPYWVPLDKFFDGMNTSDPATSKKRGLIVISKP